MRCVLLVCLLTVAPGAPVRVAGADDPPSADPTIVALLREEKSREIDRREALAVLRKTANHPARWHSGYVQLGEDWSPYEMARRTGEDLKLHAAYLQRRDAAPATAAGHRELAEWCRAQNLAPQDYVHTLAAVALEPEADHRETLTRLGFFLMGDKWLSPDEVRRWAAEIQFTQHSLEVWGEKLRPVPDQLNSPGRKRQAALRVLDQLRDRDAVPAIEWTLCGHSQAVALVGVERLRQIQAYEATQALSRQAVFNAWEPVRHAAIEALFDRKLEDFVPGLLSLLATTVESQFAVNRDDRDFLTYSYVVGRETENQFQVVRLENIVKVVEPTLVLTLRKRGLFRNLSWRTASNADALNSTDLQRNMRDQMRLFEQQQAVWNARTEELNARVRDVLVSVTGESSRETPRDWWDWWDGYNQYETPQKKVRTVTRRQFAGRQPGNNPRFEVARRSCLAAGTLVWTDRGALPVERLSVGDNLLTQDVESGELGYIPVQQPLQRDPTTVFRVTWSGGDLVATGGHRFWVPGEGWRRVNDLKPGSLLHTATGSVAVTAIEPVPDEAVYNVVISPTHNYFVGEQALLTQDVTLPRSTNRKVPGLVEP